MFNRIQRNYKNEKKTIFDIFVYRAGIYVQRKVLILQTPNRHANDPTLLYLFIIVLRFYFIFRDGFNLTRLDFIIRT